MAQPIKHYELIREHRVGTAALGPMYVGTGEVVEFTGTNAEANDEKRRLNRLEIDKTYNWGIREA